MTLCKEEVLTKIQVSTINEKEIKLKTTFWTMPFKIISVIKKWSIANRNQRKIVKLSHEIFNEQSFKRNTEMKWTEKSGNVPLLSRLLCELVCHYLRKFLVAWPCFSLKCSCSKKQRYFFWRKKMWCFTRNCYRLIIFRMEILLLYSGHVIMKWNKIYCFWKLAKF